MALLKLVIAFLMLKIVAGDFIVDLSQCKETPESHHCQVFRSCVKKAKAIRSECQPAFSSILDPQALKELVCKESSPCKIAVASMMDDAFCSTYPALEHDAVRITVFQEQYCLEHQRKDSANLAKEYHDCTHISRGRDDSCKLVRRCSTWMLNLERDCPEPLNNKVDLAVALCSKTCLRIVQNINSECHMYAPVISAATTITKYHELLECKAPSLELYGLSDAAEDNHSKHLLVWPAVMFLVLSGVIAATTPLLRTRMSGAAATRAFVRIEEDETPAEAQPMSPNSPGEQVPSNWRWSHASVLLASVLMLGLLAAACLLKMEGARAPPPTNNPLVASAPTEAAQRVGHSSVATAKAHVQLPEEKFIFSASAVIMGLTKIAPLVAKATLPAIKAVATKTLLPAAKTVAVAVKKKGLAAAAKTGMKATTSAGKKFATSLSKRAVSFARLVKRKAVNYVKSPEFRESIRDYAKQLLTDSGSMPSSTADLKISAAPSQMKTRSGKYQVIKIESASSKSQSDRNRKLSRRRRSRARRFLAAGPRLLWQQRRRRRQRLSRRRRTPQQRRRRPQASSRLNGIFIYTHPAFYNGDLYHALRQKYHSQGGISLTDALQVLAKTEFVVVDGDNCMEEQADGTVKWFKKQYDICMIAQKAQGTGDDDDDDADIDDSVSASPKCSDGYELVPIPSKHCPSNPDTYLSCDKVNAGELCEADGECGTTDVDNCGIFDMYYKHEAGSSAPTPRCKDGSELRPLPSTSCPSRREISRYPNCEQAQVGRLCEANGECGTQELDNCFGKYDVYYKWYPSCGDGYELVPLPAKHCPKNAYSYPNCDEVKAGKFCEADGECGTKNIDNCGTYDMYLKVDASKLSRALNPKCNDGHELIPVPASSCRQDTSGYEKCDKVSPGELCEADGECGTQELDNCPGFLDVYYKAFPRCGDGYQLLPVPAKSCPDRPYRYPNCDKVGPGRLCEADGECGTKNIDNCGVSDMYLKYDPSQGSDAKRRLLVNISNVL